MRGGEILSHLEGLQDLHHLERENAIILPSEITNLKIFAMKDVAMDTGVAN
jgi:hypothetical protein